MEHSLRNFRHSVTLKELNTNNDPNRKIVEKLKLNKFDLIPDNNYLKFSTRIYTPAPIPSQLLLNYINSDFDSKNISEGINKKTRSIDKLPSIYKKYSVFHKEKKSLN